jgi:hypothetical protein
VACCPLLSVVVLSSDRFCCCFLFGENTSNPLFFSCCPYLVHRQDRSRKGETILHML